ncbi:MAG TPA: hypothetical protein VKR06_11425 [Ktedonosporobacter sp.]|nr:hypothetical protein [Ktedonosporobacter sp.]
MLLQAKRNTLSSQKISGKISPLAVLLAMPNLHFFITLSGTIIGAFLIGLPGGSTFVLNVWNLGNVDLDLRVLATYLMILDLCIKYCWGVLVVRWPFSLSHNLVYGLVCAAMLGFALSMGNLNAWLVYGAATCFAYSAAYMQNIYAVSQYERDGKKADHSSRIPDDHDLFHTPEELVRLRKSSLGLAIYVLLPGMCVLYGALNNYHVLPIWLQWRFPFPSGIGWGLPITLVVITEILIWGLAIMPKERYRYISSSDNARTSGTRDQYLEA